MNRIVQVFAVVALASSLASCSEKKKPDVIIAPKPEVKAPKQTQRMSENEQTAEVEWVGSRYTVKVKRQVDTGLELVKDEDGDKYYDNKVWVRVLRSDGSEFFNHTFSKSDFAKYLDEHTKKNGAMLGVVFVKAEGDNLYFVASVGSPEETSDEYVAMSVKVSRMGSISIKKDDCMDDTIDEDGV